MGPVELSWSYPVPGVVPARSTNMLLPTPKLYSPSTGTMAVVPASPSVCEAPKPPISTFFKVPLPLSLVLDFQRLGGGIALQSAIVDESSVAEKSVGDPAGAANGVAGRLGDVIVRLCDS